MLGKITGADDGKLRLKLESSEEKLLVRSFAEKKCVQVEAASVDPASPLLAEPSRAKKSGTQPRTDRARPCAHCARPLNHSLYADGDRLKSCPNCSAENRADLHVFHPYPAAFGTSDKRVSDETPDGAQSFCTACRDEHGPTRGRRCDSLAGLRIA